MKISHYTKKSPQKLHCEDAYFVNKPLGLFGALDGVTPIDQFKTEEGYNGAYMASNLFKNYFEQTDGSIPLAEAVVEANRNLRQAMIDHDIDIEKTYEAWSTCVAIVHVLEEEEKVDFAQIGDTYVVVEYTDGHIELPTEKTAEARKERAREILASKPRGRVPLLGEELYKDFVERSVRSRSKSNLPGGNGIANGMKEAKDYFRFGSLPLQKIKRILLVTDGFFHPHHSLAETLKQVAADGLESYVEDLERAEKERGDAPDDRTAVLIEF